MKQKNGRISTVTIILCLIIIILVSVIVKMVLPEKQEIVFKQVKNYKELEDIYDGDNASLGTFIKKILTLPISVIYDRDFGYGYDYVTNDALEGSLGSSFVGSFGSMIKGETSSSSSSSSKDYSTTNIQVENVDEADVTKTDGDYIYSLSEDMIVITDVRNVEEAKVVAKFKMKNESVPQELLLYKDKIVVIGKSSSNNSFYTSYYSSGNTNIEVFDISHKSSPTSVKVLNIKQPYHTCRAIEGNIVVLSSGYLKQNLDDEIDISYTEDGLEKDISFDNMYYMEDMYTRNQTIITGIDLDNLSINADIKSYFIDLDNAYVSENNIYIAEEEYKYDNGNVPVKWLFGFGGIPGFINNIEDMDYDYGQKTTIYKFSMNGTDIKFVAKTEDDGETINQFSMDEYQGNLRVAMYDNDGTRINVYDQKLNRIGQSESLAEGEKMYSSRFIGERAYLVTYKTVDPLFVVDLSDATNPKVLGELKIPGYSTYLHPYDENHIIGIGMETKETIRRNSSGTIISTSASVVGMKMALFDVTDVSNPKQISTVVIGNSRTTSAILTNHKALLFSKDRNLIAIPVNNYTSDFEVSTSSENIDAVISLYKNNQKNYIAEGYEVYNIDLENGFVKKGTITHELASKNGKYSYTTLTHLLRGLYIEDNLYTISERMIKINRLDTLELLKEINISNATKY